jgi:hypothetical protein
MKYLFLILFFGAGFGAQAQADTAAPYLRFPVLPPIQVLLPDSTSFYTKANLPAHTPVLYMLFDPGCSHCQHETEELVAHKDDFKDIQVVMITMPRVSFAEINEFVAKYKVDELKHVVVGKDVYYFMPSFYPIHNFPFLAMYNKEGRLITIFEGSLGMDKVVGFFK